MNPHDKVKIEKMPTGVPGLDEILGGGVPAYSFNKGMVIAKPSAEYKHLITGIPTLARPYDYYSEKTTTKQPVTAHESG